MKLGHITLNVGDCFYQKKFAYKYHVVAILEEEKHIVVKYYGKRKQWWHYEVESFYHYDSYFGCGLCFK